MSNAKIDRKPLIVPGDVFNKWTVIKEEPKDKYSHRQWLCRCECGTERVVLQGNLNNGNSKDCGCGRVVSIAKALTKHGLCGTVEYEKKRRQVYRVKNLEALRERDKKYAKENPHIVQAKNAARRARKNSALPKWAEDSSKAKFKTLVTKARELKDLTGVSYHVDHIVPLRGKAGKLHVVSGLHVAENFQLLPATDNLEKYATSWPDQWTYDEAHIAEITLLQR